MAPDAILWSRWHEKASQLHMRKRLISPIPGDRPLLAEDGLDLANFGMVEITSEHKAYPIEGALQLGERRGWRAADAGPQIIRLLFDQPQSPDFDSSPARPSSLRSAGLLTNNFILRKHMRRSPI